MKYKIYLEPEAKDEIQNGIYWYNKQQAGLGRKFHAEVKKYFEIIKSAPFSQIRYENVRCLPMKVFPFVIYFTVNRNNKTIIVHAVFHTSQNPNNINVK